MQLEPISPQQRWRSITLATLVLVPAFWAVLAGVVTMADDGEGGIPNPAASVAVGLAILPFVFVVLAFTSGHPKAPNATLKAMAWSLLVGIPVTVVLGDPMSGMVAGVGAGGILSLRLDPPGTRKQRAVALAVAVGYVAVVARVAPALALLPAPAFPLTAIGMADQLADRRPAPARSPR